MKVRVFQILYKQIEGALIPADGELMVLAQTFAARELTRKVDFIAEFKHLWAACEVDERDRPTRCIGLLGMSLRPDFSLCRFTDNVACKKLVDRANDFCHDQGLRDSEVFVFIDPNEPAEAKCPNQADWLKAFKMTPAKRWSFTIR